MIPSGPDEDSLFGADFEEPGLDTDVEEPLVDADVPPELRREFLLQAGLLNLAVLAVGGGLIAVAFTERGHLGFGLLGVGVLGLALTWWRYHHEIGG